MPIPVSNTSPLIAFSRIERLDLLRSVMPRILIPRGVLRELQDGARRGEPIIEALRQSDWLELRQVDDSPLLRSLSADLGAGEAEALALALELGTTVILDDRPGRAAAERLQLAYVGTLGITREAKRMGVITAVLPVIKALRAVGIHYKEALIERVLREEGEA
jgi:predicted nucleic acid-binding protein